MKNKVNVLIIAFALAMIIGLMIYFASGMSAVNDPMKRYESYNSMEVLIRKINMFKEINNNMLFELKDEVGDPKNGVAFYYDVVFEIDGKEVNYNIRFDSVNTSNSKSVLSVIGAFEPANKVGGYSLTEKGVGELVNKFQIIFIDSLNKSQHTGLKVISNG
jgi:hypothetical protein